MASVTVAATATRIFHASNGSAGAPVQVIITNNGGQSVYVGPDANVTDTGDADNDGAVIADGGTMGMELTAGREIWGITAAGTAVVRVVGF